MQFYALEPSVLECVDEGVFSSTGETPIEDATSKASESESLVAGIDRNYLSVELRFPNDTDTMAG